VKVNETLILFIESEPTYVDKIEGEPFMDRAGYNFRRLLSLAGIPEDKVRYDYIVNYDKSKFNAELTYIPNEILRYRPKAIFTLGVIPTRTFLNLKKSAKLKDYICTEHVYGYGHFVIYPYYSTNYILQCGKRIERKTIGFLSQIYDKLVKESV
jgi:uracil-DNA glycosylase